MLPSLGWTSKKGEAMTKHTPGPFRVGEMVRQSIRIEEPERTAALVLVEPGRVRQAEAAAALIAAAPDLLECAKMLALVCAENALENTPERAEILAMARAAIAKAEGRE